MTSFGKSLEVTSTPIPGVTVWDLPVHGDSRGWFKENWQREKMTRLGLPDFNPVQNNVSLNLALGTTRGIHAEPWDKFVSVATGRVFGAWVDLRAGPTFGRTFTTEIDASRAVFVPRGVGNAFQTLEPNTAYIYLVNAHFSPGASYTAVNVADETIGIDWPIPLELAELSAKDRDNPRLADVTPIAPQRILVVGADGQLGRALRREYANDSGVDYATRNELDLDDPSFGDRHRWEEYDTVINAAAYTAVDRAESDGGRAAAWRTNVAGLAQLARIADERNMTLMHVSSDYVFDGRSTAPYREDDPICPLGVYGQTKAAGDAIVSMLRRHYILRTSWVVGDGRNFVKTMLTLAKRGVDPSVVDDQLGRLTFAPDIARAARHLIDSKAPYGTYNVSCSGAAMSWAEIARRVFELSGNDPHRVRAVSTGDYFAGSPEPVAPRPFNSVLDLTKICAVGFTPTPMERALQEYVAGVLKNEMKSE